MSKGSRPRPYSVSQSTFASNYDAIFRKPDPRVHDDAEREDEEFNRINAMQVRVKEDTDEIGRCGCGRSPTGKCIGWHGLTEDEFATRKELYETGKVDLAGNEIK
jgi:hypothetical protein